MWIKLFLLSFLSNYSKVVSNFQPLSSAFASAMEFEFFTFIELTYTQLSSKIIHHKKVLKTSHPISSGLSDFQIYTVIVISIFPNMNGWIAEEKFAMR